MHERIYWHTQWKLEKYDANTGVLLETLQGDGNMLMHGGASTLWECLIGNGSTLSGNPLTFFNNTNAAIGVGAADDPETPTQNNLRARDVRRARKGMDPGYPQHKDSSDEHGNYIVFSSTFGREEANFEWNEWGIFNSPQDGQGRMLNRKVQKLGEKTDAGTWVLTLTLSLSGLHETN